MNTIINLIEDYAVAIRNDTDVSIVGDRIVTVLNRSRTEQTGKAVQEAYNALRTAIRQDQSQGVKLATPADLSEAITDLRAKAYMLGRGMISSGAEVDDADNRVRRLAQQLPPAPAEFGKLVTRVLELGKALRSGPDISMTQAFSADPPYQLTLHEQVSEAVEAVLNSYSAAMAMPKPVPDPTIIVKGREIPPAPGFDELLNDMLGAVRAMICAEIQYGDNIDPDQTLQRSQKRFYAARDAVRCRYLGLDDKPKKEVEPCLVIALNRVIGAAKEVGIMQNQPASGVPAGKRLEEAVEQFQDTVRMLSEQGPTEAQLEALELAIKELLIPAREAAIARNRGNTGEAVAAHQREEAARQRLRDLFKVVPCVPRPQPDPLFRKLAIGAAALMVELDQLMDATESYRGMLKGTLPDGVVSVLNLRSIRHFQLDLQAVLKQIKIN